MGERLIRKMEEKDIKAVAKLIYISFWEKMLPLKALTEEEALELIGGLMFSDSRSIGYYYVAETEGHVAGMIKVKENGDKEDFVFKDHKILLRIGVVKLIKAGILLSMIEAKIQLGHLYIEMLAVGEADRGKGIGSSLLEYVQEVAKKRKSVQALSLYVIEKNTRAKALYESFGFKTMRSQWNSVVKGLGGIRKVYFMTKTV